MFHDDKSGIVIEACYHPAGVFLANGWQSAGGLLLVCVKFNLRRLVAWQYRWLPTANSSIFYDVV